MTEVFVEQPLASPRSAKYLNIIGLSCLARDLDESDLFLLFGRICKIN